MLTAAAAAVRALVHLVLQVGLPGRLMGCRMFVKECLWEQHRGRGSRAEKGRSELPRRPSAALQTSGAGTALGSPSGSVIGWASAERSVTLSERFPFPGEASS